MSTSLSSVVDNLPEKKKKKKKKKQRIQGKKKNQISMQF